MVVVVEKAIVGEIMVIAIVLVGMIVVVVIVIVVVVMVLVVVVVAEFAALPLDLRNECRCKIVLY